MGRESINSQDGDIISFTINGVKYQVNGYTPYIDPQTMLVDFIRDHALLKGTKVMCREGGCGACVVTVRHKDPTNDQWVVKGVNSCITPVYSCHGWDISTVERLGNHRHGYHKIQKRLVKFHGTQCGYCTPGMIMNMNSLLERKKGSLMVEDVEKSFDGNICRCTGYRPILDAFKSLAVDAPEELVKKCGDIEDCASCPSCPVKAKCTKGNATLRLANGSQWTVAVTLAAVFEGIEKFRGANFRFVGGNTSTGIYKGDGPFKAFIEINGVPELKEKNIVGEEVTVGGGVTLTEAIEYFKSVSGKAGFEYLELIATHLERVANVPVRNVGTLAGNLMIKHNHREFPSDIFVLLEGAGAEVTVASSLEETTTVSMLEFLKLGMKNKLILKIHIPRRDKGTYHFRSFKITRRYQNAHAYVNAAFLLKSDENGRLTGQPRIVYGGINAHFVHATATEKFLAANPNIADPCVLQAARKVLKQEVQSDQSPAEGTNSVEYKVGLTQSLLYKTVLGFIDDNLRNESVKSGGIDLPRGISRGTQDFDSSKDSVLYKEVPKVESLWQASGEAEYPSDIPKRPDELCGVFVLSTIASGTLKDVDASVALEIPDVYGFVSAKDVPGDNDYMRSGYFPQVADEPVFVPLGCKVSHHGQPLGLILAKTRNIATLAAKHVKVTYENVTKPVIDVEDALKKVEESGQLSNHYLGEFKTLKDPRLLEKHEVSGKFRIGSQYHFHMETQNCLCIPMEDGIEVYSSTQWMDHTQKAVADVLGIPNNKVTLKVRRIGGGFGAKVTRQSHIAAACAVASMTLRKPVRVVLDLETNMRLVGKRLPYIIRYKAGFNEAGQIGSLQAELFSDAGFAHNEADSVLAISHMQSAYKALGWHIRPGYLLTNTPANTWVRGPGSKEGAAITELVMDHVAHHLGKSPLEVRQANLLEPGDKLLVGGGTFKEKNLIPDLLEKIKESGNYLDREEFVRKFNQENRWKKRGLSLVPVRYPVGYGYGTNLPSMVAIYHHDASVACTHGGIEMGQGLNTKVVQTIAQAFKIPMDKISIKPADNFVGANGFPSAGTLASELACFSALKACEILKQRLKPVLEKLGNPTWEELIKEAHKAKVDLSALYTPGPQDGLKGYSVWVLALAEVEIDVLTGEYKMVRADVLEDAGKSLSPGVDLGQVEGGYVFGQGLWTTEEIIHDKETGELLTDGTWNYKVPETRDIPEDFRVTLLKNVENPTGVLRSKSTGEPVANATVAVYLALKNAIAAARKDKGRDEWFEIDAPITPKDVYLHCLTTPEDFSF